MKTNLYVAIKQTQGVYNDYYGVFETKDDAWAWINKTDPYRQGYWSVANVDKVN